jgi:hypothetical protein
MNTPDTTPSAAPTSIATFYAFRTIEPDRTVIVALKGWLGPEEGWLAPEADVLTLPDGTVANLDPASAHKCYANFDPASWDILNVISCPAKPGADDTKKSIVDALKKNGTARVPWSFDKHDNMLVLHPVTVLDESGTIRLNLTHMEPNPTYSKDRPSSWQGITAILTMSGWTREEKQQLSMIVSGRQPIDCFRFNSKTNAAEARLHLNKTPVTLQIRALSTPASRQGSSVMYKEEHQSTQGALGEWSFREEHGRKPT